MARSHKLLELVALARRSAQHTQATITAHLDARYGSDANRESGEAIIKDFLPRRPSMPEPTPAAIEAARKQADEWFLEVMTRRCARGDEDIEFLVNTIAMAKVEIVRLNALAYQARREVERVTGILGHVVDHVTRDEDFDANELLGDIRGSVDLSEYERLRLRAENAEAAIECARREGWEAGRDAGAMAAKNGPVTGTWRERRAAIVEAIRALTPPSQAKPSQAKEGTGERTDA